MTIVERKSGITEYYPSKGFRFVKKDRTVTYSWFLILKKGDSIENYEEIPEDEAIQIEAILQSRKNEIPPLLK